MKKIRYFLIISLIVLIFTPIYNARATPSYVGVKINSTQKSGGGSFNLPAGTKITILNGSTAISTVYTTTVETPVGSTVWSSLVDLTTGQSYNAKLEVSLCMGKIDTRNGNNYCWYKGNVGENCTQVCARNSTTPLSASCNEIDTNCVILTSFGYNCTTCYFGSYTPYYYFYSGSHYCYSGRYPNAYCSWSDTNYSTTRICTCNVPLGNFTFPFIP